MEIKFLPPVPGRCQVCGGKHGKDEPHDERSAYLRMRMREIVYSMKEWKSKRVVLPTKDDADKQNCVLVWHMHNGVMVLGWHQVEKNPYITHWMRVPDEPDGAQAIKDAMYAALDRKYGAPGKKW